ncbi:MAG: hypothetical protein CL780_06875 [Chloroflexi bacterium]|nr:hypothetical protein [Chloroflexota bacterium]
MSDFIKKGLKNATYLTIGNLVAQLIAIVSFSYIAVMLGPDELGKYSTAISFVAIFTFLCLPGIDRVLLIQGSKNLEYMSNIMSGHFRLKIISTVISLILCILLSYFMPYDNNTFKLILLFSFSLIFRSIIGFLSPVFQAHERMEYLSLLRIFRSLSFSLMAIAVLFFGFGVFHVILVSLISTIITSYFYYHYSKSFISIKSLFPPSNYKINMNSITIFSFTSFLVTVSQRADVIFLSIFATISDVGLYAIPIAIIVKLTIVRNTLAIGFSPVTVKQIKKNTLPPHKYFIYSLYLLLLVGFCSFLISFKSEYIMSFFGKEYLPAHEILKILIFSVPLIFATVPFTLFLQSTGNEYFVLLSVLFALILKIPLMFLFFGQYGLLGVVYSTLTYNVISLIILCISTYVILFKEKRSSLQ